MSLITNYWPDPRFIHAGKLSLNGCVIASHNSVFNPAASSFPGISLKATRDGDNWASLKLNLNAGMTLIASCLSNGAATSASSPLNIWSDSQLLAQCPSNGGASREFTVPDSMSIGVCLRAPKQSGSIINIMDVFIGTKADYDALAELVPSGFCAGDLMPLK